MKFKKEKKKKFYRDGDAANSPVPFIIFLIKPKPHKLDIHTSHQGEKRRKSVSVKSLA